MAFSPMHARALHAIEGNGMGAKRVNSAIVSVQCKHNAEWSMEAVETRHLQCPFWWRRRVHGENPLADPHSRLNWPNSTAFKRLACNNIANTSGIDRTKDSCSATCLADDQSVRVVYLVHPNALLAAPLVRSVPCWRMTRKCNECQVIPVLQLLLNKKKKSMGRITVTWCIYICPYFLGQPANWLDPARSGLLSIFC
jgi:hypothetical protein